MAIQILPPEVVDQISAGEVVERPAHMVKELVENCIDANATEVEVEFSQGGRWVKVRDNGKGMTKDDLSLCLARHATSKIKKSADIWALNSFGFRGEALASISSVCRISITTRQKDQSTAFQLSSEFGKAQDVVEVGGEVGTTIQIEELFENMPARLKFLKSEAAESTAIKNTLKAIAMAHPGVSLRVRQKGKLLYFWPAQKNRKDRVSQVLERANFHEGEGDCEGLTSKVVVSSPNETVKNSRQIWLFVQNRWVQDRSLQTAVMEGYRSLLMHGEYPVSAIWLDCDPEEVDVNIHPSKSQVKFRVPSSAFRAVNRGVRGVLERAPWLEDLLPPPPVKKNAQPDEETYVARTPQSPMETKSFEGEDFLRVQYPKKDFKENNLPLMEGVRESVESYSLNDLKFKPSGDSEFVKNRVKESKILKSSSESNNPVDSSFEVSSGKANGDSFSIKEFEISPNRVDLEEESKSSQWANLQVLGQAHLTYIVAQSDKALVFVDQHAAHERVAYEQLMASWKSGDFEVQSFLLPLNVELEPELVEALMVESGQFERLGLNIDQIGPETVGVRSAPAMIKDKALQKTLEKLASEIYEKGGSFALEKCISDVFATMACHSVVRAGQALSQEQMASLLEQMDEFPMSSFCPHGRPVYVEYPFGRLERDFGRIV